MQSNYTRDACLVCFWHNTSVAAKVICRSSRCRYYVEICSAVNMFPLCSPAPNLIAKHNQSIFKMLHLTLWFPEIWRENSFLSIKKLNKSWEELPVVSLVFSKQDSIKLFQCLLKYFGFLKTFQEYLNNNDNHDNFGHYLWCEMFLSLHFEL